LFFFTRTPSTEFSTLSLHDALPILVALLTTFFVIGNLWLTIVLLTLIAAGTYASKGPFWALSSEWLGPTVAAAGLAQINALGNRSEEHTSELQSRFDLVCRLLLEKK